MYSTYANVTKVGYDLISKKLSGQIQELKITAVAFGGSASLYDLVPYNPSVYDTAIPNELFRIKNFDTFLDPEDGFVVVRVSVSYDQVEGEYFLNAIGIIVNDNYLFASNSLSIVKVEKGNELVFDVKIPFVSDSLIDLINLSPPKPESLKWIVEGYEDNVKSALLEQGYSGIFYDLKLSGYSISTYFVLTLENVATFPIDYLAVSMTDVNDDNVVLFSNVELNDSFRTLSIKIEQPFKELVVACKELSSDVIYSIKVYGVRTL